MPVPVLPPIIPRETLFGNPERVAPQISPDGVHLAYLAPHDGVLNIWVRTLGKEDDHVVTRDRRRGIRQYLWTFDGRLLFAQDTDGDENWHVWLVDPDAGIIRDLTPFQGAQAQIVALDSRRPTEALLSLNVLDARLHDVYRADLNTGGLTLDTRNPGDVVGWNADADFSVRGATAAMPDGGFELRVRDTVDAPWRSLIEWGPDEEGQAYGFTEDGAQLQVADTRGANTQELRLVSVADGTVATLAAHPVSDISDALCSASSETIRAVAFNVDRTEWTPLDPGVAPDFAFLRDALHGDFAVCSMNLADDRWIVLDTRDTAPAAYYLYDRTARTLEFLFTARPKLEQAMLAVMEPVVIVARDGLELHSYLTLPVGVEPKGLPLVLNVHGGPWARDAWGYDAEAQWLANRGYACLQVNFRGSTGFGKAFVHAGDREWGAKMHEDLLDAVKWATDSGVADSDRICIYGGSYGGYSALVGVAFTPEVFACAVDIVGPSSLRTLIGSIPPYWEPLKRLFSVRVGDLETEAEFLDSRSPLHRADQICRPLLIAQGANDPRVKQAESEQIVEAMRRNNQPVEYLLFEDEGHGFARPENRLRFYAAAEKFLAGHLGGRSES